MFYSFSDYSFYVSSFYQADVHQNQTLANYRQQTPLRSA